MNKKDQDALIASVLNPLSDCINTGKSLNSNQAVDISDSFELITNLIWEKDKELAALKEELNKLKNIGPTIITKSPIANMDWLMKQYLLLDKEGKTYLAPYLSHFSKEYNIPRNNLSELQNGKRLETCGFTLSSIYK